MEGLASYICNGKRDVTEIKKLFTFLNEKDQRRKTNWMELFPWLEKYKQYVV
jgi:hypothetical protein